MWAEVRMNAVEWRRALRVRVAADMFRLQRADAIFADLDAAREQVPVARDATRGSKALRTTVDPSPAPS